MLDVIHLSTTGVAEIAVSTHLIGCPNTFVYVVYFLKSVSNLLGVVLISFLLVDKLFRVYETYLRNKG